MGDDKNEPSGRDAAEPGQGGWTAAAAVAYGWRVEVLAEMALPCR